jgi:hypothetical protein
MEKKNPAEIKQRILSFLKENGPSLPSSISSHIGMDMMFASAFLSELASEKKIKISNMKVGSSPIYYLEETLNDLDKFSEYLKNKEKEAFNIIKDREIVEDSKQEPAIRIALRQLKDFAKPLEKNGELYWKYFKSEKEIKNNSEREQEKENLEKTPSKVEEVKKTLQKKKTTKRKIPASQKKNEKFFNTIKEFLNGKGINIEDIEGFSKNDLILKIKERGEEKILLAFDKKRITETDILKAHKKAEEQGLRFKIICKGDLSKKLENFIGAIKNMSEIEKIE